MRLSHVSSLFFFGVIVCVIGTSTQSKIEVIDGITQLEDENYQEILSKNEFVFVEFYAPWCGACKEFAPEYKRIANMAAEKFKGKVVIAAMDATSNPIFTKKSKITQFPTLLFFKKSDPVPENYGSSRVGEDVIEWIKGAMEPLFIEVSDEGDFLKRLKDYEEAVFLIKGEISQAQREVVIAYRGKNQAFVMRNERTSNSGDIFAYGKHWPSPSILSQDSFLTHTSTYPTLLKTLSSPPFSLCETRSSISRLIYSSLPLLSYNFSPEGEMAPRLPVESLPSPSPIPEYFLCSLSSASLPWPLSVVGTQLPYFAYHYTRGGKVLSVVVEGDTVQEMVNKGEQHRKREETDLNSASGTEKSLCDVHAEKNSIKKILLVRTGRSPQSEASFWQAVGEKTRHKAPERFRVVDLETTELKGLPLAGRNEVLLVVGDGEVRMLKGLHEIPEVLEEMDL